MTTSLHLDPRAASPILVGGQKGQIKEQINVDAIMRAV